MAFATNNNLQEYAPEVFEQGVDDWTDELAKAQVDVINLIDFQHLDQRVILSESNLLFIKIGFRKNGKYNLVLEYNMTLMMMELLIQIRTLNK